MLKSQRIHIVLLGCPGVGKFTTGKLLSKTLGCPLFDNAKVVDIVSLIYEFGTSDFITYRDELRKDFYFRFLTQKNNGFLISTNVIRTKKNWEYFDELERLFTDHGWRTHYFVLTASEEVLLQRVENPSRLSKQTIMNPSYLKDWLARNPEHSFCDKENSTFIDISYCTVEQTVFEIIETLQRYDS